jgi:hypothetical protein
MALQGGGWLVLDNAEVFALLKVSNPIPTQGKCLLSATEWRSWDGFDTAPGSEHLCLGDPKLGNWPTYQEVRFQGVQLTGYAPTNNSFDLGLDCYGIGTAGAFCAGPLGQLLPVNTAGVSLQNGVKSPLYTRQVTLAAPTNDFGIRSREQGAQAEGVIWNTGAIWLR